MITWAVADSCVEGRSDNGNVEFLSGIREALDVVQVRKRPKPGK